MSKGRIVNGVNIWPFKNRYEIHNLCRRERLTLISHKIGGATKENILERYREIAPRLSSSEVLFALMNYPVLRIQLDNGHD